MNSVGKWVDDTPQGTITVNINEYIYPTYRYITENNAYGSYHSNDIMKGMHFSVEQKNIARPASYLDDMRRSMSAFIKAQAEYDNNPDELDNILNSLPMFESFEFTIYDITVSCTVTYSGYDHLDTLGLIQADKSIETYFKLDFSMIKN